MTAKIGPIPAARIGKKQPLPLVQPDTPHPLFILRSFSDPIVSGRYHLRYI